MGSTGSKTDTHGLSLNTPSHGNPRSTNALNTELNNVARNTNDTAKARQLVAAGAQLSSTNGGPWHHTPLHQAAYHGRYAMAATLVQLGAPLTLHSNPCGRGSTGTPLELARGGGHQRIAQMLEQAMAGHAAPKPSARGSGTHAVGTWTEHKNIDMCMQGDVEIVHDWRKHTSLEELKRIVEANNWSAITVGSFGHAALKDFDFALTPQHCKRASGYTCSIHIYTPPTPKPAGGPKPRLVLVKPGDRRACVFEHAAALRTSSSAVPLTLKSHPGLAVVDAWSPDRQAWEWTYVEMAVGPAAQAARFRRSQGKFLERADGKVLDVAMWKYHEGNHLVSVIHTGGNTHQTHKGGGGRDFDVRDDGTIRPTKAAHLVVGLEFDVAPPVAAAAVPMATVVGTNGLPNDLQVVQGTPVEAGASGSAPPLAEMVARFKRELKLKEAMTMADAMGEACTALGVKREGSLIEQAQKCWAVLCG